jgi:hypothetical protein
MPEVQGLVSRKGAENYYRYKGRVTRNKEKQRRYPPFLPWERSEVSAVAWMKRSAIRGFIATLKPGFHFIASRLQLKIDIEDGRFVFFYLPVDLG